MGAGKLPGGNGYAELVSLLQTNPKTGKPVQDLSELMPLLPQELLSNFTFVYQSRSPHGELGENSVDPLHPRILLFSKDGRLTMAFTGNPGKPGFNTLEVVHFEEPKARFELSQFVLPAAGGAADNGLINPPQCLRCHGVDPKPITDSYPLWPGFYGSVRDTFPKESEELLWYRKFLKEQSKQGLYRFLNWPNGTSVPPYLDPKRYNRNTVEAPLGEMKFLPNTRLGMAWTELNRKRIQRKLKGASEYSHFRYALLSGLLNCTKLPISTAADEAVYRDIYYENEDRLQRLGYRPKGPGKDALSMMELGMYHNLSEIEYVARVLQLDSSDWSLAYESQSSSFFDGILSSAYGTTDYYLKEDFVQEMLRDLAKEDPAFKPYFRTYTAYPNNQSFGERLDIGSALGACKLLKQRQDENSLALPVFASPVIKEETQSAPELLEHLRVSQSPFERCAHCHETSTALLAGRKIPFSSPNKLSSVLHSLSKSGRPMIEEIQIRISLHGIGQMPPRGERLTQTQIKQLTDYLQAASDPRPTLRASQ